MIKRPYVVFAFGKSHIVSGIRTRLTFKNHSDAMVAMSLANEAYKVGYTHAQADIIAALGIQIKKKD